MLPLIAQHEEKAFLSYMRENRFMFTGDEYLFRLGIFLSHKRYVKEFNKQDRSFKLGLNHLSHYTDAEYRVLLGALPHSEENSIQRIQISSSNPIPTKIDWREKGVVNPIKDQGHCGSCWAFSVVQAQESAWAIKHGELFSLSESNLVDCCFLGDCNGGMTNFALDWVKIQQDGKFNLESDYPYAPVEMSCRFDASKAVTKVIGKTFCQKDDENELVRLVSELGVASVCIDASGELFHHYKTGIYDNPACQSHLNHAVGLVGFGEENGVKYWIVRNSWGNDWGEEGYIRMIRGKNNQCGIASNAFFNIVE